jgi:uncharacterized protein
LLQREVTEVGSYFSVIKAIAAGNHNLSFIESGNSVFVMKKIKAK